MKLRRLAIDTQRQSFTGQGTGVRALEVLEHTVGVGDQIGRHLSLTLDGAVEVRVTRTGGDFSKRVIFH